ncbi:hypothetical protein PR048_001089 [Dryococelus australis]|uniref:Uncharacterized protein n=1 Tax=Dryococelus australis TaxID=614101 RepID=A0ABQ9IGG8_9NEOP|nr:hypothetical protein PR048_001089 [Dryococelus australis]
MKPDHQTFAHLTQRLQKTGTFQRRCGPGRPRTVRTLQFEEAVLEAVADNASTRTRAVARRMDASHGTVWVQAMRPAYYAPPPRVEFCRWFMQQCGIDPDFPAIPIRDETNQLQTGKCHAKEVGAQADQNDQRRRPGDGMKLCPLGQVATMSEPKRHEYSTPWDCLWLKGSMRGCTQTRPAHVTRARSLVKRRSRSESEDRRAAAWAGLPLRFPGSQPAVIPWQVRSPLFCTIAPLTTAFDLRRTDARTYRTAKGWDGLQTNLNPMPCPGFEPRAYRTPYQGRTKRLRHGRSATASVRAGGCKSQSTPRPHRSPPRVRPATELMVTGAADHHLGGGESASAVNSATGRCWRRRRLASPMLGLGNASLRSGHPSPTPYSLHDPAQVEADRARGSSNNNTFSVLPFWHATITLFTDALSTVLHHPHHEVRRWYGRAWRHTDIGCSLKEQPATAGAIDPPNPPWLPLVEVAIRSDPKRSRLRRGLGSSVGHYSAENGVFKLHQEGERTWSQNFLARRPPVVQSVGALSDWVWEVLGSNPW